MYYPSGLFRLKARTALKGHWQWALLVALIVNLPTLLMQGFSAVTGNDLLPRLQSVAVTASRDGVMSQSLLVKELNDILNSTAFWTIRGLEILALLITPCLALGMYKWLMDLLRGQENPVSAVFCRVKLFFRAIGLQLLIILKVLLWMLPGIAVMVALMIPLFRTGNAQAQLEALQRSYNMTLPVMLLMIVPGAMAALRYALSEYIMAEEPGTKILECIRRSKELMKNQKKNLFFLVFSFLLWYLLEILIASLLSGVLSLVFQMFAGLALNVYMACSVAAFYLHLASGEKIVPEQEQAPEELN